MATKRRIVKIGSSLRTQIPKSRLDDANLPEEAAAVPFPARHS
jgi:hypothetical protein